jgi:hypothetical protein
MSHGLRQSGGHGRRPRAVRGLSWPLATGGVATPAATRARVVREGAIPTFRLDHGKSPAEDLLIVHHDWTPVDSSPFQLFCRTLCRGTDVMPGFRAGGASVRRTSDRRRDEPQMTPQCASCAFPAFWSLAIIGTLFNLARAKLVIEEWLISMVLDTCPAIRFRPLVG